MEFGIVHQHSHSYRRDQHQRGDSGQQHSEHAILLLQPVAWRWFVAAS